MTRRYMLHRRSMSTSSKVAYIAVALLLIGGYIANIVKLVGSDFDPMTGLVVARILGVVVSPLGALLGFL